MPSESAIIWRCILPGLCQQGLDHFRTDGVSERLGVRATILLPAQLTVRYLICNFLRQVNGRELIVLSHCVVSGNRDWRPTCLQLCQHVGRHEVGDHDVRVRIVAPHLPSDATPTVRSLPGHECIRGEYAAHPLGH